MPCYIRFAHFMAERKLKIEVSGRTESKLQQPLKSHCQLQSHLRSCSAVASDVKSAALTRLPAHPSVNKKS